MYPRLMEVIKSSIFIAAFSMIALCRYGIGEGGIEVEFPSVACFDGLTEFYGRVIMGQTLLFIQYLTGRQALVFLPETKIMHCTSVFLLCVKLTCDNVDCTYISAEMLQLHENQLIYFPEP